VSQITRQLLKSLYREALSELDENSPPRRIDLSLNSSVAKVTLVYPKLRRHLIVKSLDDNASIVAAEDLYAVHQRVRARAAHLTRVLPVFLGFDARRNWLFIEFVAGQSFSEVLSASIKREGNVQDGNTQYLQATAQALLALHEIEAIQVGIEHPPRPNASFLADFEMDWNAPIVQRHIPE
jgi:hypothetical protein